LRYEARLVGFGEIEGEGTRYTHDVVIDDGKVRKRKKGPSKQFREKFGHAPHFFSYACNYSFISAGPSQGSQSRVSETVVKN